MNRFIYAIRPFVDVLIALSSAVSLVFLFSWLDYKYGGHASAYACLGIVSIVAAYGGTYCFVNRWKEYKGDAK